MVHPVRKNVPISSLHQLLTNPRTDEAASDVDAISKLYSAGHSSDKNLVNLALEIAEDGFDENEPIYVVQRHKRKNMPAEYDVYEGNRRLAALNLLLNPSLYSDFVSQAHINALIKAPKNKLPRSIEVTIVDEAEARSLMERNHGGALGGYGRIAWSAEAQRRYARSSGNDNSFVGKTTAAFEQTYGQPIGGYIGGITTADRLFKNKDILAYVGELKNDLPDNKQLEKIKNVLDEAKEVKEEKGSAITRVFATKKDIERELLPRLVHKTSDERTGNASSKSLDFLPIGILRYVNNESITRIVNLSATVSSPIL